MKQILIVALTLLVGAEMTRGQSGSINNTLGTGGSLTIKDGTTTFLTLTQSDGLLSLSGSFSVPLTSSSTIGVIFKGASRFIHDFSVSGTDGFNTFVGVDAGSFSMSGSVAFHASNNTGMGHGSLTALTTGYRNSAFGTGAMQYTTTGAQNSAFGYQALAGNTTGGTNSAFGSLALYSNTIGGGNSAFGHNALSSNTSGQGNSAFGSNALANNGGSNNSAFGGSSLTNNSSGIGNCAFGPSSLLLNTTGSGNCAFGYESLLNNSTNGSNSAFGSWSLRATTGSNNTAIGYQAGYTLTSGSNNTFLGNGAIPSSITASNEIVLGNASVSTLRCNTSTISALSDRRDKRDIQDLPMGLEFLMTVRPRVFHWDRREWYGDGKTDGSKMKKEPTAGFIAQELDEAQTSADAEWLNLVLKSNPERLEATPGNLLPIIVKAIQDLKLLMDQKDVEIRMLREQLQQIRSVQDGLSKKIAQAESGNGHDASLRH
jgi:hypothetical protein